MRIELEIKGTEKNNQWMAQAIVDGKYKPSHLMESSEHGNGCLRIVGGNPNRFFKPDDELWWLELFAGKESVRVTGELCEKA